MCCTYMIAWGGGGGGAILNKNECICFVQFEVYSLWLYSVKDTMMTMHSQSEVELEHCIVVALLCNSDSFSVCTRS